MDIAALLTDPFHLQVALRLTAALVAGGLIGLERSYHGRPAGFRTHALVSLSTSLLMMVTVYEDRWWPDTTRRLDIDPTRIAQGILTGIGFLGAGTIMKDGLSVSGLTTAASIWMTAAIGILMGIGFYAPAVVALLLTFGTLSLFRRIESSMPTLLYAQFVIRFPRNAVMPEGDLRRLLDSRGFSVSTLNYRLEAEGDFFEYRGIVRTNRQEQAMRLSEDLTQMPTVKEFRLWPTGD